MTYSLLTSGIILYVRARIKPVMITSTNSDSRDSHHNTSNLPATVTTPARSSASIHHGPISHDSYSQLCHEFTKSKQALGLKSFVKARPSLWQLPLNSEEERQRLKRELLRCFKQIALDRPDSLYSNFQREDAADVDDGHAGTGDGAGSSGLALIGTITRESSDHIEPGATTSSGQHYLGTDDDDNDRQPLLHDAESDLADPNADADDTDGIEYSGCRI